MKKLKYFLSVFLTYCLLIGNAKAMWPDFTPLIPFSPQFCIMCVPPAISAAVTYVDHVKTIKDDLKKYTEMTTLKQMALNYAVKLGNTELNKWRQNAANRQKIITYARTIEDSKVANVTDEAAVKDAFIKLFMQYPSKISKIKEAYKLIGEQLKMDTTLEMYITAVELEKKLYGDPDNKKETKNMADLGIIKQIDLIEKCLVGADEESCKSIELEGCQASKEEGDDKKTKEDQACFWNSSLYAERLYEAVMRYNLFLAAMHAQYRAVIGINQMAQIKEYKEKENSTTKDDDKKDEKKSSAVEYLFFDNNFAASEMSATLAFADMTEDQEKRELENELREYEYNLTNPENIVDGEFEEANQPDGYTSALSEREDDVKSMEFINDAQRNLDMAMKLHNMQQMLPDYKQVYQDYEDIRLQKELALKNLQISGECVLNMIKPYYNDINSVWFGENCMYYREGQLTCHYAPEKDAADDSNSQGIFDILCPDNAKYSCYTQELSSANMPNGVAKYLFELYSAAKDEDAAGDTEPVIEVTEEQGENDFVPQTTITSDEDQGADDNGKDYVVPRTDDSQVSESSINDANNKSAQSDANAEVSNLLDQEKGEKEKEQTRKDGILRWALGAEVAKEMARDLDTGVHSWGSIKAKFPLWNDQIAYYNQYIDGKYENIQEYIEQKPVAEIVLQIATDLNVVYPYKLSTDIPPKSAEAQRKEAEETIKDMTDKLDEINSDSAAGKNKKSGNNKTSDFEMQQIDEEIAASEARIQKIKDSYQQNRQSVMRKLSELYKIMNDANAKINEINKEHNENTEVIREADSSIPQSTDAVDYGQGLYTNRQLSQDSPQNSEFNQNKSNNAENQQKAENKNASLLENAKNYEDILARAQEKVAATKEELERLRINYVKQLSTAEIAEREALTEVADKIREARNVQNHIFIVEETEIPPLDLAAEVVQCIREYAQKQVTEAKEKIDQMKTDLSLYYTEGAEQAQAIHREMIDKITHIKIADLAQCAALGKIKEFDEESDKTVAGALTIFEDICADDFCKNADEQYFVGALGLPRDFAAPKTPLDMSLAPVREIFHFDLIDFNNMDKYYDYDDKDSAFSNDTVYIAADNFMDFLNAADVNYSAEDGTGESSVPVIWKYMLRRHTYGHKSFDWTQILGDNQETAADLFNANTNGLLLLRSGIFPCKLGDNVVDVYDEGYAINATTDTANYGELPQCLEITIDEKTNKLKDVEAGGTVNVKINQKLPNISQGSELGTILSYVADNQFYLQNPLFGNVDVKTLPHHLTFNKALLDAMNTMVHTEDLGSDPEEDTRYYKATRIMYERNQFGDYLDQVEYENIVRDAFTKVEQQIEEIRQDMEDTIAVGDFEISEDFSLLNDDDYQNAVNAMKSQEKMYTDMAVQSLSSLPNKAGDSQNVRDKVARLMHIIAVLQKDSEALVAVSGDEELDELEEKIKTNAADRALAEKYAEEKKKEAEKQREQHRRPYCSVYSKQQYISQ